MPRVGWMDAMIRDRALWSAWETAYIASQPADFNRNLALAESMYEYARALGAFSSTDPLEGIDTKVRLARVVNVPTTPGTDRSGA